MYQFFVEDAQVGPAEIVITGSDVNHIGNVLRMKPGEKIRISDTSGRAYFCHVKQITADLVTAVIDETDEQGTELKNRLVLYQGLPKSDKMELIIQKAVELGASRIVPVAMKNCVAKLEPKKAESKVKRWQAIAESAAKQSKRTRIPEIALPLTWKEALKEACDLDLVLVPYENERGMAATREVIRNIKPGQSVGIMIGPEGGFAADEIASIEKANEAGEATEKVYKISLGRRILRTETAGLATLAMLVYELDE